MISDAPPSGPLGSLQSLFGAGDPLGLAAEQLAESHDPRGRAALLAAVSDRFEASVLFGPATSARTYTFAASLNPRSQSAGLLAIAGPSEPWSDTLAFLRPRVTSFGTLEGPISLGDLVNLAA